jgi:hypothetical protein
MGSYRQECVCVLRVPGVKGNTICVHVVLVPRCLHRVDRLREDVELEKLVKVEVVAQAPGT